jgi:lipopolysaccharide export system permease protein
MLSAGQINRSLDSLTRMNDTISKRMYRTLDMTLPYTARQDSIKKTLPAVKPAVSKFDALIPDSIRYQVNEAALSLTNNLKFNVETSGTELEHRKMEIRYHKIELHRKFSLSMACFIGAPLGSIIRKGGLGMPLVVAIIFFLMFHLLNMFGEKFVKEGIMSPFFGMWLAVLVLTPVGIFFTYKAMHDSQLFNKEFYYRMIKNIKGIFKKHVSPT